MTEITIQAEGEKLKALKAIFKALRVEYIENESPYDPEFVAKIRESQQQAKEGKVTRVSLKQIKQDFGL